MNKKIIIILLAIIPVMVQAQLGGYLGKVKSKVNQKINQRADDKVDRVIEKSLDKAEGKENGPTSSAVGNPNANTIEESSLKRFSKYDFVAGEKILYYDNFENEVNGELPTAWNTNGSGEVVSIEKIEGKWLQLHKSFTYLSSNKAKFSENYTVEFDVIMQLKNNGWMFPTFSVGLLSTNDEPATNNSFLKEQSTYAALVATMYPGVFNSSKTQLESFADNKSYFKSEPKDYKEMEQYFGKPMHVAIQAQKERLRVWINETKAFDVPKGIDTTYKMNQLFFKIGGTNYAEEQYGMFISNIKVAQGLPETRHKLIEEGKFSTTAILFDVNSANIKPESAGVLKEIGAVLNEYKGVKIKIIGHTDSDGTDAENLTLSQKRATAIKDALIKNYEISGARIETEGKGETDGVADNKTKEGKAANRRVEFVKL